MAWKYSEDGSTVVLQDGNPVWIGDDGAEVGFDAKANIVAAATAKREAGESRAKLKDAETKLSAFASIDDPAAALKALAFVQSMDGKKVMDDEGYKKAIEAGLKPLQDEVAALKAANGEYESTVYRMQVSDKFNTSKFLKEKSIFGETPDIAQSYFGKNFKVENGNTVAYDNTGSQIYSTSKPGEPATFDEALSFLINAHPQKDHLLRATGGNGSGSQQSSTSANALNAQLAGMSPTERITAARAAGLTT